MEAKNTKQSGGIDQNTDPSGVYIYIYICMRYFMHSLENIKVLDIIKHKPFYMKWYIRELIPEYDGIPKNALLIIKNKT